MNEKQLKALIKVLTNVIDELEEARAKLHEQIIKKDADIMILLTNAQEYRRKITQLERKVQEMSKVKYFVNKNTKELYYEDDARYKILEKLGITITEKGENGCLTEKQEVILNNIIDDYLEDFKTEWEEME